VNQIKEKLSRIPQTPGVYLLKKSGGKIIYVGKAKKLRNRLHSHFRAGKDSDLKHRRLMSQVEDFEYILTDTEIEALILEANLIKEHKPRYNVNLKDDKTYPYIRITSEPYPRVFITRRIIKDGSIYLGPYTDVGSLRKLISAAQRIFPIRTCTRVINSETILNKKHKVCLNFQIGRCFGPCEGRISQKEYLWNVDQVVRFIKGKNSKLLKNLNDRMLSLAKNRLFEEAARLRDEIESIKKFSYLQKVVDSVSADRDIITVASKEKESCCVVFNVREGRIINRLHFYLENREEAEPEHVISAFIKQFYMRTDFIPGEILIPFNIADREEIEEWLKKKRNGRVSIVTPKQGKKAGLMRMSLKNAELLLEEMLIQKKEAANMVLKSVETLQKDLNLKQPPVRIEAFDISNIQGKDSVASLVVFENGRPKKSEYRKYKIKTVEGPDDFRSMAEVVERRISRLLKENRPLPDLILVDGGKGQLSAASEVLLKFGLKNQPVIGLAKKLEEVFIPGYSDPQNIPKTSPALYLLQRIRDEAHRFAITFHRQRRKKRTLRSVLDDIPGIGEKRRNSLLKAFGSVEGVKKASISEIEAVAGVGKNAAQKIVEALKNWGRE